MEIAAVEAIPAVVPLERPVAFARRMVAERHFLLVRVRDSAGGEGIGFCYVGNFGGTVAAEAVRELIAPLVVGESRLRSQGIWEDVYQATLLHGRAGVVMRALSAVDIALWDLNARSAGLPLWQYLGAVSDEPVPAYASGGYYQDGKGPGQLAEEMLRYVADGFDAVKMKIGRVDPREDAQRIGAVREAVGPDVKIMLDANNAWTNLAEALRAMRRFEPFDPYWIEEPFSPDDIENHAALAARTSVPVATGEIEAGRWRHSELLRRRAVAMLQTDAAVCGGITEFRRIAAAAEGQGVPMSPHWFHDLHVHLVASTANAVYVEYFPTDEVLNFGVLMTERVVPTGDGRLQLPRSPGIGFDFDPKGVARFAIGSWS